jgi:hypothetical protein
MAFNYNSYAKNLQELLRNPNNWLTGEKENLIKLNLVILEHNGIYAKLSTEQKATVDSSFSKCPGQLNEIKGINDADRLLFAVFGSMHPMNPSNKVDMLRKCVDGKLEAMRKLESFTGIRKEAEVGRGNTNIPNRAGTNPGFKEKYLKYKNKYLKLKNNF